MNVKSSKVGEIRETTNYGMFHILKGNRNLDERNVASKVKIFQRYGWIKTYPMDVVFENGRLFIRDGQHRFEAAKRLGIAVVYSVTDQPMDVAAINDAVNKWKLTDYITRFAAEGKQDYLTLFEYAEYIGTRPGIAAALLSNQTCGDRNVQSKVKAGEFEITTRKEADTVVEIIQSARLSYQHATDARFIMAIARCCLVPGFSVSRMKSKIKAHSHKLHKCATQADQLQMLEEVYNYHSATDKLFPLAMEAKRVGHDRNFAKGKARG